MKTKRQKELLTGKLLSYSAAAGAIFALGQNAEAQVVYTDVDPDDEILATENGARDSLNIDFNNDEIIDVTIIHGNGDWYSASTYFWKSVRALNGPGAEIAVSTLYAASFSASYYFGARFDNDAEIGGDGDLAWGSLDNEYQLGWFGWSTSTANTFVYGPWTDAAVDKYLGVRFTLDEGATYNYGWVRLNVALEQASVTVLDYAYETEADKKIKAGSHVTAIENIDNEVGAKMFSFEKSIIISDLARDNGHAEIFNVVGQLVHSTPVRSGRTEIQMENEGLYIVKLKVGNEFLTRKVLVK